MSFGKERETKSEQKIDPQLAAESNALVNLFRLIASGGYQPNRGVTIAGFTPKQNEAFSMGDAAATAFGFAPSGRDPMPATEESAYGIAGYRPSREYDAMREGLPPEYLNLIENFYKMLGGEGGGGPSGTRYAGGSSPAPDGWIPGENGMFGNIGVRSV